MIIRVVVDEDGNYLREEVVEEQSPWMTIQEAAAYLRCTDHTIHEYARRGIIQKFRVRGFHTIRLKRSEIESLVEPVPQGEEEPAA